MEINTYKIKTTCLTNIYNEEYLLPFWLNHHKYMFDEIIIVDYRSTDKSLEICKSLCPNCKIISSRNKTFGAIEIDEEFMDLEKNIEGIKIILNTTEFLFCETPMSIIFSELNTPTSFSVTVVSPYSKKQYNINNNYDLLLNLLNDDVVYHKDRWVRQIHNFSHGNYRLGRHETNNPTINIYEMHIVWLGYYPLNEQLLKRKLQVQTFIPKTDKDQGFSFQHFFNKDKLLAINNDKANTGGSLQNTNLALFNLIKKILNL